MTYLKENRSAITFSKNIARALLICCFSFVNCSDDDGESAEEVAQINCGNGIWTNQIETELNNWLIATIAHTENPTDSDCDELRDIGQAYLVALENAKDCVPTLNSDEYEQLLEEVREDLKDFSCDDL